MDSTGSKPAPDVLTRLGSSLGTGSELVSLVSARARALHRRPPAPPSSVRIETTIAICPGLFLTFSETFLTLFFPNKTKNPLCLFWILVGRLWYSVFSSYATCSSLLRMRTIFFCFFFLSFLFFSFGLVLTDFIQSARRIGLPFFAVSFLPAVIRILSTLFAGLQDPWFFGFWKVRNSFSPVVS